MLQQRSFDSVKIISIDRDKLLARLREIAERICVERPEVTEVRVFGSIARGDHVGTSDVDVLILLEDANAGDVVEQARSFYPYFDLPVGVDMLVFTREQLADRLRSGDAFVERMWRESQRV
jgi:predicted nucleotidyltransferase